MDIRVNVFLMFHSLIISDCHVGRWSRGKKLIRMLAVITREIAQRRMKNLIITSSLWAPLNTTKPANIYLYLVFKGVLQSLLDSLGIEPDNPGLLALRRGVDLYLVHHGFYKE